MSEKIPHSDNPKIQERINKAVHRDSVMDHTLRWVLHYIERLITTSTTSAPAYSLSCPLSLPAALSISPLVATVIPSEQPQIIRFNTHNIKIDL